MTTSMASSVLSCFSLQDHLPSPTTTQVQESPNREKSTNALMKEAFATSSQELVIRNMDNDHEKEGETFEESKEDGPPLQSPINAEVVQCGDNISLKQPSNIDNGEKQCISGLELVLYAQHDHDESSIVKNPTSDEPTSAGSEKDSYSRYSNQEVAAPVEISSSLSASENVTITNKGDTITEVVTKPLFKIKRDTEHIGRNFKASKTMVSWEFQHGLEDDAVQHYVTLTWSKRSSKISIHMDGNEIFSKRAIRSFDTNSFHHVWNSPTGLEVEILSSQKTNSGLILWNHKLTVNGELYDDFKP